MSRAQLTSTVEQNSAGAAPFSVAGKNKIINGDFGIWQRGTSFTTNYAYTADRFIPYFAGTGATQTISQQTLTPGSISGYESQYFMRNVVVGGSDTTNNQNTMIQYIENVQTLTGQVTVSFWMKANSGTPKIGVGLQQGFGSGGSSTVVLNGQSATISTSWARYSFTFTLPSISGKTIGAGSSIALVIYFSAGSANATFAGFNALQSNTFDIWGVQLEAGSVATPFTTASNTLQGELALCQRYYQRWVAGTNSTDFLAGAFDSATIGIFMGTLAPSMRVAPSVSGSNLICYQAGNGGKTFGAVTSRCSPSAISIVVTTAGASAGASARVEDSGYATGYLEMNSEL